MLRARRDNERVLGRAVAAVVVAVLVAMTIAVQQQRKTLLLSPSSVSAAAMRHIVTTTTAATIRTFAGHRPGLSSRALPSFPTSDSCGLSFPKERTSSPLRFSRCSSMSMSSSSSSAPFYPRAAVSVCIQCSLLQLGHENGNITGSGFGTPTGDNRSDNLNHYYLLVQRGKEPNKGLWSLPGGKLEWGETSLEGGMRELREETSWPTEKKDGDDALLDAIRWHPYTVCATDSIGEGFHYLIAQMYGQLEGTYATLPEVVGTDDAADADWFTLAQLRAGRSRSNEKIRATPGVTQVVERMEELANRGLLPTSLLTSSSS